MSLRSLLYLVREGLQTAARNPTLSIAALISTAASLLVLRSADDHAAQRARKIADVSQILLPREAGVDAFWQEQHVVRPGLDSRLVDRLTHPDEVFRPGGKSKLGLNQNEAHG